MNLREYIQEIDRQFQTGIAREHSYRPALQHLLADLLPQLIVTNEPARISCGAPDFIISRKSDNAPLAFVEAKDIDDIDLDGRRQHKEQFNRYKSSLDHIIFTDYLDFHFYQNGEWVENIRIGEVKGGKIVFIKAQEERFISLISHLVDAEPQRITSANKLAGLMAAKARLLAETIRRSLETENDCNSQLYGQLEAIKRVLIHDITPESFADIYAQTIAYGMFAARLHDDTPDTFSRQEAAILIPKTNPFLRQIFQSIAGYDLDDRIAWIVDDLAVTFRATDLRKIMTGYEGNKRHSDPMIHFYEDFLSAYDPRLRKAKGVWYTPQPVVRFIVRAVDEILQRDFSLPRGLADYSQVEHEVVNEWYSKGKKGEPPTRKKKFHKVQILDPATGTGTFLAETVNQIYDKFQGMEGMWQGYVEEHLLPRLNGFELLMASYAIAHLKLDMLLQETGYVHQKDNRLNIYLTNSLEECHPDTGSLFAQWLSNEANAANRIKRDTPVMVMIGNPPYSVSSNNNGEWITNLIADYKKGLNEKKININDDYCKFIRLGHYYIEKNGEGILAYISNNSFINGITYRQMRKQLLNTFDKIYILNLHGNSKKKEVCPDGSKDENVFDIMQGVSINIFIKTGKHINKKSCKVLHHDLFGSRKEKYNFLNKNKLSVINWEELLPKEPYFFFEPKNFSDPKVYLKGFSINNLFSISSTGIESQKDAFCICDTKEILIDHLNDLIHLDDYTLRDKYNLGQDGRNWKLKWAKEDIGSQIDENKIIPIDVFPFETKFTYYTGKTNGFLAWPRNRSLRNMLVPLNFSIITPRQTTQDWRHIFISKRITNGNVLASAKLLGAGTQFPLYTKTTGEAGSFFENQEEGSLVPNFNPEIIKQIEKGLGEPIEPLELFDYIYAILHSPTYRERYKEFLKIDFPRIPYPTDKNRYHQLSVLGSKLRKLHLLENSSSWKVKITYPQSGTNKVESLRYHAGNVYINEEQYFGNVTEEAWDFYIGGYQPAQKWLKDRKEKTLSFSDIRHYQEIITALCETQQLMKEIDVMVLPDIGKSN